MQSKRVFYKAVGVIAGAILLIGGIRDRAHFAHLHATGKIAVVDPISAYTRDSPGMSSTYSADIHFVTDQGVSVSTTRTLSRKLRNDVDARQPVRVLYDPLHPSDFIFEHQQSALGFIVTGMVIAIAVVLFA